MYLGVIDAKGSATVSRDVSYHVSVPVDLWEQVGIDLSSNLTTG